MDWLFGLAILGFLYYFFVMRKAGNLKFWQLAARRPNEAMMFFATRDCFFVDLSGSVDKKSLGANWVGPFLFSMPSVSSTVKIYGPTRVREKVRELIDAGETVRNFAFPDHFANGSFHFLPMTPLGTEGTALPSDSSPESSH